MKHFIAIFLLAASSVLAQAEPIVIAHRGASGYLPEHTLEAAILAYTMGSDYIEQDLVLSKDGVAVVLHDIHLDTVTNVAKIFPNRHRDDGRYYVLDFTLSELKQLKVHERKNRQGQQVYPGRYQGNGHFTIATFAEQIELIDNLNRQFAGKVGLYPEIKSPAWHREQGYDISQIVITEIRAHGLDNKDARIYLQCFDFAEIKRIATEFKPVIPLVQLIGYHSDRTDYAYLRSAAGINEMRQYVTGVGPAIPLLVDISNPDLPATDFMQRLQAANLEVHPYTHRIDQLPAGVSSAVLLERLFAAGATGIFTDFPDQIRPPTH
jgi:glycerophosphoryl diester phosphodiesterase